MSTLGRSAMPGASSSAQVSNWMKRVGVAYKLRAPAEGVSVDSGQGAGLVHGWTMRATVAKASGGGR